MACWVTHYVLSVVFPLKYLLAQKRGLAGKRRKFMEGGRYLFSRFVGLARWKGVLVNGRSLFSWAGRVMYFLSAKEGWRAWLQ